MTGKRKIVVAIDQTGVLEPGEWRAVVNDKGETVAVIVYDEAMRLRAERLFNDAR